MTAKEYLSQYRKLEIKIESKLKELDDLQRRLTGCSARQMDGMPHASGGDSDPIGRAVTNIVAMQQEINKDIDKSIALRQQITARINRLDNETYAALLRNRYILMLKWEELAEVMHYSEQHCRRIHGQALADFTKTNKDVLK